MPVVFLNHAEPLNCIKSMDLDHSSDSVQIPIDIEQAAELASLCDHLLNHEQDIVDRKLIRKTLEDSLSDLSSPLSVGWTKVLEDVFQKNQIKYHIVDCTAKQFIEISQSASRAITFLPDGNWLGAYSKNFKTILAFESQNNTPKEYSAKEFSNLICTKQVPETFTAIVLDLLPHTITNEHTLETTLQRQFWNLLKPERTDLWNIVIYAVVIGLLSLALPLAVEALVSSVAFGQYMQPVLVLAIMLFLILSFMSGLRALQTFVAEIIQRRLYARIVADLSYRIPRVHIESFDKLSGRELINRYFEVVTIQKVTAQLLLDGVTLFLNMFIGMAVLAFYHPWLLGFDILLLSLLSIIVFVLGYGAVKTSIKESKSKYHMANFLEQLADSPITLRYAGASKYAMERVDHICSEYLYARQKHFRVLMRQILFSLGLQVVTSTLLLGLGGWLVISGQLTLGQLVAAQLIVATIVDSFAKLGKHLEGFYDAMASVDKLNTLFQLPIERQTGQALHTSHTKYDIKIAHLSYGFENNSEILSNINISIDEGERLAILGPSACGKSILLDVIYGLRSPTQGQIYFGGNNYHNIELRSIRSQIVLVRNIEIFEGTIAENLHLDHPGNSLSDVDRVLNCVGMTRGINKFSEGIETEISPNGYPLTSNQMRKLMIARALIQNPKVILVDSILDALPDGEAEEIIANLSSDKKIGTVVLVTGRQTLAQLCNRQLVLDGRES